MEKILYVIDRLNKYGSEKHVYELMDMVKENYNVTLCYFNEGDMLCKFKEKFELKNFHVNWYPSKSLFSLRKYIKVNHFKIVHAHQPKAIFWTSIICKTINTKCIITIHSLPKNNKDSHSFLYKYIAYYFHLLIKWISEFFASSVIFVSRSSLESASFKKKSKYIPNWIDSTTINSKNNKLFNSKNNIELISIGTVSYNKGYDRLIDAMALIKNEKWKLNIIGDYDAIFKEKLQQRIKEEKINNEINFLGYIDDVPKYLERSDFFILFSRSETFGLVFIEAMAHGLPIIMWNLPIVGDVVPAENLILNSLSDIRNLFDPSFLKNYSKISTDNKTYVNMNFSKEIVHNKYKEIYD